MTPALAALSIAFVVSGISSFASLILSDKERVLTFLTSFFIFLFRSKFLAFLLAL